MRDRPLWEAMLCAPRVAIVQHRMIFGGRLAVLVRIVEVLNQLGIVPDFVSTRVPFDEAAIERRYGLRLRFSVRELPVATKVWRHEIGVATFGALLRALRLDERYDVLIDSNNTSLWMPRMPIVSYVHYPRKARLDSPLMNIHKPEGRAKSWRTPLGAYLKLVRQLYRWDAVQPGQLLIANSEFTRQCFLETHPSFRGEMPVVFPPVDAPTSSPPPLHGRDRAIVSLGRFCPAKQQLEQVRIAESMPDWRFHLVGFVDEKERPYLQRCREHVARRGMTNVEFHVAISEDEKRALLQRCRFFLHTNVNEPFGITTVEGILNGCAPIVHDSGGQREIVPFPALRMRRLSDIREIVARYDDDELEPICASLWQQARERYSVEKFAAEFRQLFETFLARHGLAARETKPSVLDRDRGSV